MAGSPTKRARKARTAKLLADSMTIDTLCARIASCETLADICKELDVKYLDVQAWIQGDDIKRKRYAEAIEIRKAHQQEVILRELTASLSADISDAFDANGQMKPLDQIPPLLRRCIAGIEMHELFGKGADGLGQIGIVKKIKFWDKPRQIELLAKHLKMLTEKHEVTGANGAPIQVITGVPRPESE